MSTKCHRLIPQTNLWRLNDETLEHISQDANIVDRIENSLLISIFSPDL